MGGKKKSKSWDVSDGGSSMEIKAMSFGRENGQNDWVAYDLNVIDFLARLSDPDDHIRVAPWREFGIAGVTYYFTPGGFLHRKDIYSDELGGFYCGYVSDKIWREKVEDHPALSSAYSILDSS